MTRLQPSTTENTDSDRGPAALAHLADVAPVDHQDVARRRAAGPVHPVALGGPPVGPLLRHRPLWSSARPRAILAAPGPNKQTESFDLVNGLRALSRPGTLDAAHWIGHE